MCINQLKNILEVMELELYVCTSFKVLLELVRTGDKLEEFIGIG